MAEQAASVQSSDSTKTAANSTDPTPATPADLDELIAEQEKIFVERQPKSRRHVRARGPRRSPAVVTSSWQITRPQAVWLSHGKGSKIYDVDGNEYVDLHGGYGAALAGHAHPAIVEAVRGQVARGTHFAQPTENAIARRRGARPAGSACRCGGSPTPAPRPRWTPST